MNSVVYFWQTKLWFIYPQLIGFTALPELPYHMFFGNRRSSVRSLSPKQNEHHGQFSFS